MRHGYSGNKDDLVSRLRKIEGQVRGIQRMVEQDAYCIDILTQISAVVSGVEKVGVRLLSDHIRGCIREALTADHPQPEKVDELVRVVERFIAT